MNRLKRFLGGIRRRWLQRYYWLSRWFGATVPVHNLSWLPDGFVVRRLGNTGIRLIEQFCTADEAGRLIDAARARLDLISADYAVDRVSETGCVSLSGEGDHDPLLLPLVYRGAVLAGRPYTTLTDIVIGRVRAGDSAAMLPHVDGRHVVRVYLDAADGSAARFPRLNLAVTTRVGRALFWSSASADDARWLDIEEAVAGEASASRWFLQLNFGDTTLRPDEQGSLNPPQARRGVALSGTEAMPAGVWAPETIDLEAVFGQPDKMEGLL